ncbi:MAG: right-handed parallel beta-helix repeat-containing protein [Victivallales bacterium]
MGNIIRSSNLFVSINGSDSWSGGIPEPAGNGANGPFATLEKALAAARKMFHGRKGMRVQIWLRGGVYRLDRTLEITPRNLGAKGSQNKLIISAFPGEQPVLSGGRRIENLTETQFNGKRCWTAEIPEVKKWDWQFAQLFANGARRFRPRLPKQGFYRFAGLAEEGSPSTRFRQGPDRAIFHEKDIRCWKNLDDVDLVAYQLWFDMHHRIKSVDVKKRLVVFHNKSTGNLRDDASSMVRYYVENVFESLDLPGEWYLDRPSGLFYYLPLPDEKLETTALIAPSLETLVRLKGSPGNPVRNVVFENIAFEHAEWIHPEGFAGSTQAGVDVPGAVNFDNAEDCVLYGCSISKISQYGVELLQGCSGNKIVACTITDMGAGGVKVGHEWLTRKDETSNKIIGKPSRIKPSRTSITDCEISNGSWKYPGAIGIWVGNAGGNLIAHNHVHDLNYTGISLGWTWGYAPTATVGDLVEGNHVHHINMNHLLADNGGIYTLGQRPGCVLRRNLIHHVGCYGYGGFGIYHDEGTSEQIVEQNIVHHTKDAALFTHYGRDNILRNNIFAMSGGSLHINPGSRAEKHRTTVFERNIVCWRGGGLGQGRSMGKWSLDRFLFHDNLFWSGSTEIEFGNGVMLGDWQRIGQFENTVIADPLMTSPETGDFTLRADSPALKTGFVPFSLNDAGPRMTNGTKPASFDKWSEPLKTPEKIIRTSIDLSSGKAIVTVKNVGTAAAGGDFRIAADPADVVELLGSPLLHFNLKPGKSVKKSFSIKTLKPGHFCVSATPIKSKFLVHALAPGGMEENAFSIPLLGKVNAAKPNDMPGEKFSAPLRFDMGGKYFGTMRMAVCNGSLIAVSDLVDIKVSRGELPWEGSCLELFFAPAAGTKNEIVQLFIVPKEDGGCEVLRQSNGTQIPQEESFCKMKRTTDGWSIDLSLNLKSIGIDFRKGKFLFEAALNGHYGTKSLLGRIPLCGAAAPHSSLEGYAEIRFHV